MSYMRKRNNGFTLVELIVAIGIMAILAGMLMGGIQVARRSVKKAQASTLISSLELGCRIFENEWGFFPHDQVANLGVTLNEDFSGLTYNHIKKVRANAVMMLQLLTQKKNGPYFEPNEDDIVLQTIASNFTTWNSQFKASSGNDYAPVIIDPWGMPYVYDRNSPEGEVVIAANHNIKTIDMYSYGPNVVDEDGGEDDINNW